MMISNSYAIVKMKKDRLLMKNKKILIPIIIFVIVLLITGIGYISHVNKKNHYIETQKVELIYISNIT